jgi:hypothetical protein
MPYSAATFSAVSGIESTPYISRMRGLMKRQPSVESAISRSRANGAAALLRTNGARDMLSTPPATTSDASPQRTARAACTTASMPDPHSRLTVTPGTSTGRPASSAAIRATLRLSSPAWFAQPRITSSTARTSRDGLRASSALIGSAASSSARTPERAPP